MFAVDPVCSYVSFSPSNLSAAPEVLQDQNFACRWTWARPSRNLASTRGDGKCRVDAPEIHTYPYMI